MAETTTVRVHRDTRERLARLSRVLGVDTTEEVVVRALDLLEADLFWEAWQQAHADGPDAHAREAAQGPAHEAGTDDGRADADG